MTTQGNFSRNTLGTRHLALSAVTAVMMFCAAFFNAGGATAAEIKLLASANAGIRSALTELVPKFETAMSHRVRMDFAPVVTMKRRIDAGETFDVVMSPGVDELLKEGKVVVESRAVFARDGLSMGVPKGAPKPDISSVDALKRTLLNAKSIGYSQSGEPGIQFFQILDRLGIAQDVRSKLKGLEPGELAKAVERHEVEIVVVSSTAILAQLAVTDVVGRLPAEIQRYIEHSIAISAATKEPQAAKALLQFLLSPTATAVFKAKGFERD